VGKACSTYREKRNAHRTFVGKPEGNRPLGRPRRRWVDSTKIDIKLDEVIYTGLRIGTSRGL
jgi:hypothetical protein